MSPQQIADDLLREHQQSRLRLSITRADALFQFYSAERRAGADALTANERMAEFAKRLDGEARDLNVIRECLERTK